MFDNNRILIVDDNELIHEDFKKILLNSDTDKNTKHIDLEKELFGSPTSSTLTIPKINYEISFAFQGQDALEMAINANNEGKPYALIFMDVRMPPGWDGIETIFEIWKVLPNTEIVICSAYSDYSWDKIIEKLGTNDHLIFLKKPFDAIEVKQLALALVKKWNLYEKSKNYVDDLEKEVSKRTKQLKSMVQELMSNRDKLHEEAFIRKAAEQEVITEKENLFSILNNVPDSIIVINSEGKISLANSAVEKLLNISKDNVIGENINDVLKCKDLSQNIVAYYNIESTKCYNRILKLKVDNIEKTVITSCSKIRNLKESKDNLLISLKDITEQTKLEEELIKVKKYDSVSSFAGGFANDFENIISGIIGNITLAKNVIGENHKVKEYLNNAEDGSIKASILNQQLHTFSKDFKSFENNNYENKISKNICIITDEQSIKSALVNTINNLGYNTAFDNSLDTDLTFLDEKSINLFNGNKSKVILLSIFNKDTVINKYPNLNIVDVLEKPFKLNDVDLIFKNNL